VGCLASNKQFDFGADEDHDADLGIFNEIFTVRVRGNCRNHAGSAALEEVCGLRALRLWYSFLRERHAIEKRYRPTAVLFIRPSISLTSPL